MKAFEYGYCTRDIGLIYSKGLDPHGVNALYAYADSAHSLPRSQGCEIVMMNGGAICVDSKRHTVTCTSTCHDELLSFSKATKKCLGFRSLMQETGMYQNDPTVICQDNEAAIKVLENRGSLSSKTKHIDMNVLSSRNSIEDRKVRPVFKSTKSMVADIGTKSLTEVQFCMLRDTMNGYGLVKHNKPDVCIPSDVIDPWK